MIATRKSEETEECYEGGAVVPIIHALPREAPFFWLKIL